MAGVVDTLDASPIGRDDSDKQPRVGQQVAVERDRDGFHRVGIVGNLRCGRERNPIAAGEGRGSFIAVAGSCEAGVAAGVGQGSRARIQTACARIDG